MAASETMTEDATSEEMAPLLSPEAGGGNNNTMITFGTVAGSPVAGDEVAKADADIAAIDDAEFKRRRNTFKSEVQYVFGPHVSLITRRKQFRKDPEQQLPEKMGFIQQVMVQYKAMQDANPVMRETIRGINNTYGSGISSLFYDWRWLILMNFGIFLFWGVFVIGVWLLNPPHFADSNPPFADYWSREDLTFKELMGGASATGTSSAIKDSFAFYTGYTEWMGKTGRYPMGPIWVALIIGSMIFLFANINGRLVNSLKERKKDPGVEHLVRAHGGTEDRSVGLDAQELILGSFDYSATTEEGVHGSVKALLTGLETILASTYKSYGVPAHLQMGTEVFEIRTVAAGRRDHASGKLLPSMLDYQAKVQGKFTDLSENVSTDDCILDEVVHRRKLEAGKASVKASPEELQKALDAYLQQNPAAAALASESMAQVTGSSATKRHVIKCILTYGSFWETPHAPKQQLGMDDGWKPSGSWSEAASAHFGTSRYAFVFTQKHGEAQSATDYAKQAFGLFMTLVLFCISGSGVYVLTTYQDKVAMIFGPYAVTVGLVVIQNVIPVIVKQLVLFEGWSSEELVMRWTLGRVYVLKMANLTVLLNQLNKMGNQNDCATLEAGLYLFNLVITGSIIAMMSNFGTYYAMYKLGGDKAVEYDNQTVAQQYIELNYTTALVWIGFAYCPMLPFAFAMLNLMEIAWMSKVLTWFCKCADKPFTATPGTKMLVCFIFFATFAFCCGPLCIFLYAHPTVLYSLNSKKDTYCGPIVATDRRYQALLDFLLGWFPQLQNALTYATNPAILFGVVALLCVMVAFNFEASQMVREEASETYMERLNSEAHLRETSIQNRIMQRERDLMEDEIASLKQQVLDLENGKASLAQRVDASEKKRGGLFGGGSNKEKDKQKTGSCFAFG